MTVRVLIRVEGDTDGSGLMPWLVNDPVARNATFSAEAGRPDEMGVGEVVQAVIQNATALGGLVVAVAAWRDARRSRLLPPPQVQLERNGVTITVTSGDLVEVERIVHALTQADEPGASDGPRAVS